MQWLDTLSLVWRYTRQRWLESLLIVLAIAIGSGVLGGIVSLVLSMGVQFQLAFDNPQFRAIRVQGNRGFVFSGDNPVIPLSNTQQEQQPQEFSYQDMLDVKAMVPGIAYSYTEQFLTTWLANAPDLKVMMGSPSGTAHSVVDVQEMEERRRTYGVNVVTTTPDYLAAYDLVITKGSNFTDNDVEEGRPVAVIGDSLARRLFGEADPVGKTIALQTGNLQVIGVMTANPAQDRRSAPPGIERTKESALVPLTAQGVPTTGRITNFSVMGSQDADPETITANLRSYFQTRYGDRVSVSSNYESFRSSLKQIVRIAVVVGIFGSAALWIAAINILNLLLARVLRRTRAVGLAKALGASRRRLFLQTLCESLLLGVGGGLLGTGLSIGAGRLIGSMTGGELQPSLFSGAGALVIAVAASLVFGIYPAVQTAAVEPIEALRAE